MPSDFDTIEVIDREITNEPSLEPEDQVDPAKQFSATAGERKPVSPLNTLWKGIIRAPMRHGGMITYKSLMLEKVWHLASAQIEIIGPLGKGEIKAKLNVPQPGSITYYPPGGQPLPTIGTQPKGTYWKAKVKCTSSVCAKETWVGWDERHETKCAACQHKMEYTGQMDEK